MMRNRWNVEIKKGYFVEGAFHSRAAAKQPFSGIVVSIDLKSDFAKAYGSQITIKNNSPHAMTDEFIANADDITSSMGPMTVGRGGVVKQNPARKSTKSSSPFYATVTYNGMRGSWFPDLSKAIAYAEDMLGVVAIEEIGEGIVWKKPDERGENPIVKVNSKVRANPAEKTYTVEYQPEGRKMFLWLGTFKDKETAFKTARDYNKAHKVRVRVIES